MLHGGAGANGVGTHASCPRAVCVVVCQGRGGALVVCKAQGGLHTYTSLHPRTVERGVSLSFKFC